MLQEIKTLKALDALGNPIIVGASYGYSQSYNGNVRITIGTAENLTKRGLVSIKPSRIRVGVYGDIDEDHSNLADSKKRAVRSCILFPISLDGTF